MLAPLVNQVRDIVRSSKSDNTNKQYDYYFGKFLEWRRLYKFSALPADVCIVVLYISYWVQKNVSVSVLNSNFFSISWKHDFNLVKNPCKEKCVVFTIEGARRILSKPVKKKETVTIQVMKMLYIQFVNFQELTKIRIYCMFSLAFSGCFFLG